MSILRELGEETTHRREHGRAISGSRNLEGTWTQTGGCRVRDASFKELETGQAKDGKEENEGEKLGNGTRKLIWDERAAAKGKGVRELVVSPHYFGRVCTDLFLLIAHLPGGPRPRI